MDVPIDAAFTAAWLDGIARQAAGTQVIVSLAGLPADAAELRIAGQPDQPAVMAVTLQRPADPQLVGSVISAAVVPERSDSGWTYRLLTP